MADNKNIKVLIVEDETFLRELYEELLNDEGFNVTVALDGVEAMEKIADQTFDLTLLDIMLPRKDGLSVLEELGKQSKREQLGKVIMLTNLGQDAIIKRGFDLGADGYLIKSAYTPDQILKEINNFLNK